MRLVLNGIDLHVQGDPTRVVFGGGVGSLAMPGDTVFEQMLYAERERDWLRRFLLREPRGAAQWCADLVVPATDPRAVAGYIILEQQDYYAAMSGTNTIAVATALLDAGLVQMVEPVTEFFLQPPAGTILVRAHCEGGRVLRVDFENVPAFVTALDAPVRVPGHGELTVSVGFGGMGWALLDADQVGLRIEPGEAHLAQELALAACQAVNEQIGFRHPEQPDLDMVEGLVLYRRVPGRPTRLLPVNSGGTVGRSPSGTTTSALAAMLHARGECAVGDEFDVVGMLDNAFHCRIVHETTVGGRAAVVPEIGGRAWVTARTQFVLEDDDPFPEGFIASDLWAIAREGSAAQRLASRRRGEDAPAP